MLTARTSRRSWAAGSIALALLATGCASFENTPAQDAALTRWTACRNQMIGPDLRTVGLDGRITFWANSPDDGLSMVGCLASRKDGGPALPAAVYEIRPKAV